MLRLRKSERTAHLVIQLLQSIVLLPNIAVLFGSGVLCKLCKQDKERSPLVLYRDSCMAECSDFNTMQTKKEKMGRNCYKRQLSRIESLASMAISGVCTHCAVCGGSNFSVERESENERESESERESE